MYDKDLSPVDGVGADVERLAPQEEAPVGKRKKPQEEEARQEEEAPLRAGKKPHTKREDQCIPEWEKFAAQLRVDLADLGSDTTRYRAYPVKTQCILMEVQKAMWKNWVKAAPEGVGDVLDVETFMVKDPIMFTLLFEKYYRGCCKRLSTMWGVFQTIFWSKHLVFAWSGKVAFSGPFKGPPKGGV